MAMEGLTTHARLIEQHPLDDFLSCPNLEVVSSTQLEGKAPCLPCFEFSTVALPRSRQFCAWHDNFAPILELSEIKLRMGNFEGRQKLWDLGSLVLAQIGTDSFSFSSPPAAALRDPIDHWTMTVLLSGQTYTNAAGTEFAAKEGEVQVHSLGRAFTGVVDESEMLILFVPRDFSLETGAVLGSAEFSKVGTGMARLFSDYLIDVTRRLPTLARTDLPGLAAATRAMILACISPSPDHIEAAEGPIANVLLERARRLVQSRLLDPKLGSELVRRELAISRTRLYNLFKPFGGVMHYIQHRRLLSAYAALTDPNDRRLIFQIAEERGFSDGAEFSRAFKRAFGNSPRDVRNGGSGSVSIRSDLKDCPSEERLGVLLRRLQG